VSGRHPPGLFPESDARTDILCALTHLQAAQVRLKRHPGDNVLRELVLELDVAQIRLNDRLRAYPAPANRGGAL